MLLNRVTRYWIVSKVFQFFLRRFLFISPLSDWSLSCGHALYPSDDEVTTKQSNNPQLLGGARLVARYLCVVGPVLLLLCSSVFLYGSVCLCCFVDLFR